MKTCATLEEALKAPNVRHLVSSLKADGTGTVTAYQAGDFLPTHCKSDALKALEIATGVVEAL